MRILILLCVVVCGAVGCSEREDSAAGDVVNVPLETYEIVVANRSETNIYPVLGADEFLDDLGVVGRGAEKHEGFVPFRIGWQVSIAWREGSLRASTQTVNLATAQYTAKKARIKSLQFSYKGNSEWTLTAYDGVALGSKIVEP